MSGSSTVNSFTRSCIYQQGFTGLDDEQIRSLNTALRFTPAVCMLLMIIGLVVQSSVLLFLLAAIGWSAAAFPKGHIFDRFYNGVIRPLVKTAVLPPNPAPRRFACGLGGTFAAGAAISFLTGLPWLAYVLGGFMVAASFTVATTHWCIASWVYELVVGKPESASA